MPTHQKLRTRIPVTLLVGFLGAGKTTLLRRLLSDPQGVRFGVLINDFGAVDIDSELVVESSSDTVSLSNGCVCCSLSTDLVDAMRRLLDSQPTPEHIIIEASGISRPLPLLEALEVEALEQRIILDGVFCLVDGAAFDQLDFESTELALEQATGADLVIVTKSDLATPEQLRATEDTLRYALPRMRMIRASGGDLPRDILFAKADHLSDSIRASTLNERHRVCSHADDDQRNEHRHDHEHDHGHTDRFESWHWQTTQRIDEDKLRLAIKRLPPGLLRVKGIFHTPGRPDGRLILQLVGKRSELTYELSDAPKRSAAVAIGVKGSFDPDVLEEVLSSCVIDERAL
ncbi:CobW family GTP-binding protein [Halotalea alkalilenta]|uniref:CobW family GTP-binding protein n=1 Tax=Halotalea alkalilenta TaxID=376489 RepID=UPI0004846283|nr:GTP-binding protein [Halotalea alkalilenta]